MELFKDYYPYSIEKIKAYRKAMGISSGEFAKMLGVSRPTYSKVENYAIDNTVVIRIACTALIKDLLTKEPYKTKFQEKNEEYKKVMEDIGKNLLLMKEDI